MDIECIPIDELINDRFSSLADIELCKLALLYGVDEYSGGKVQDRIDNNLKIISVIDLELERRKIRLN
jgi:hypothetical protein